MAYTNDQIQQIVDWFFNQGTRQYIGSRYVPVFADPIAHSSSRTYEPLTIVVHQGNSYTSKQYVPTGIAVTDTRYWALTGNYNAQIEQYREEVQSISDEYNDIVSCIPTSEFSDENTVKDYIDEKTTLLKNRGTIIIIGDSYSYPALPIYTTENSVNWVTKLQNRSNYNVKNYSRAGAGFIHSSGTPFPTQAQQAIADTSFDHDSVTRIIVIGGINDISTSENMNNTVTAAANTFDILSNHFKNAQCDFYPTWYPAKFTLQAQLYISRWCEAAGSNGFHPHQEFPYILMNYRLADVYCSDNIHPSTLGQSIIFANLFDGEFSRYNGALTTGGGSAFDAFTLTSSSNGELVSFTKSRERFGYDGKKCFASLIGSVVVNNLRNTLEPVIVQIPINNGNYLYYEDGTIIPINVHSTALGGYVTLAHGIVWNSNIFVYITPLNNWLSDTNVTINFYVNGIFEVG